MSSDPTANSAQTDLVDAATAWLAIGGADKSKHIVPQLRRRFSLTPIEAVEAVRQATLHWARSS
jgi:hypothetical protein